MSFEEPNDPRSSEIGNNQIQLTELATYEEWAPAINIFWSENLHVCKKQIHQDVNLNCWFKAKMWVLYK